LVELRPITCGLNLAKEFEVCTKVTCSICGKPTWSGCGEHIEEALQGVAEADRCAC
jgi:hypothetical protein